MPGMAGPGSCEVCARHLATRRAKFTAKYLESSATLPFDEESLREMNFEKKVCEECLATLQKAENVSNLVYDRL